MDDSSGSTDSIGQKTLMNAVCGRCKPGQPCEHQVYLHAGCHITAGLTVCYLKERKVLEITCAACNKPVNFVAVAKTGTADRLKSGSTSGSSAKTETATTSHPNSSVSRAILDDERRAVFSMLTLPDVATHVGRTITERDVLEWEEYEVQQVEWWASALRHSLRGKDIKVPDKPECLA